MRRRSEEVNKQENINEKRRKKDHKNERRNESLRTRK